MDVTDIGGTTEEEEDDEEFATPPVMEPEGWLEPPASVETWEPITGGVADSYPELAAGEGWEPWAVSCTCV